MEASGKRESFIRYRVVPQALAFAYYQLSWLLYALNPRWSYGLNADFEDMPSTSTRSSWTRTRCWREALGRALRRGVRAVRVADLFRQIGHDERIHKEESLARMGEPRFS